MSSSVEIVEVSPRDGLQNEPGLFSTEDKIGLIGRAVAAGVRRLEVVSFVNPKRVPQMADAEAVMAGLDDAAGISTIGLVLNPRGLDRALAAGVDEINYVLVASDTFSERNNGAPTFAVLADCLDVTRRAKAAGLKAGVTISVAFGCPFEGEMPVARIVELARRVAEAEPFEISLADTIGVASPREVRERFEAVRAVTGDIQLRGHFHNTRNTGVANVAAAVEAGVRVIDSSLGGIGGCPFAPAATGNVPTEDIVYMLHRMGYDTGLSLERLIAAASWLQDRLGRPNPGLLGRAGPFPKAAA